MTSTRIPEKLRKPSSALPPRPKNDAGIGIPLNPFATISVNQATGEWEMRSNALPLIGLQLAHMLETHFLKALSAEAEKNNAEINEILASARLHAGETGGDAPSSPPSEVHGEGEQGAADFADANTLLALARASNQEQPSRN